MDMKRDYYEDIQLFDSGTKIFWFIAMFIALGALPFIIPSYTLSDISYFAIHIIVAIGLNILVGFTGQISLGHAGFFAIGAYSTALLMKYAPIIPFPITLVLAALCAAAFGFILGLPSLKLEGPYLAIATLGFGMAIIQVLGRFPVFGGRMGFIVPDTTFISGFLVKTGWFSKNAARDVNIYYIIMPITIILGIAARNLSKTRVGRAFIAIRDDDIAAETMGINLTMYKTLSFAVSAFYAGIAGGLYAMWIGFISPDSFDFILSILFLAMIVVGGIGSIPGPVFGALVVTFLNLNLKHDSIAALPGIGPFLVDFTNTYMHVTGLGSVSFIIFGLILMLIVVFEPLGLYGFWIRIKKYWKTWPF